MMSELHEKPAFGGEKAVDISLNESSVVIGCAALSLLGQVICDNIAGSKVTDFRNQTSDMGLQSNQLWSYRPL